jgi:hypothetical protein
MSLKMEKLLRLFKEHPEDVGETYLEHMLNALRFAFVLLCLTLAGVVHSIFPFFFEKTVSAGIKDLNRILEDRFNN